MRARIREACDGLGWFLGPAAILIAFAVANTLLELVLESGAELPLRLDLAGWLLLIIPVALAVVVVVAGLIRRHLERNPHVEDFGFGHGIDPEFIERRLVR